MQKGGYPFSTIFDKDNSLFFVFSEYKTIYVESIDLIFLWAYNYTTKKYWGLVNE